MPRVGRGDIKPRRIEGHFVDAVSGLRPVLYHDQLVFYIGIAREREPWMGCLGTLLGALSKDRAYGLVRRLLLLL